MKLSLKLRQDVLDLLLYVQECQGKAGDEPWSDSAASKNLFGHGEFVHKLRQWDGGPKGPTMESVAKFEQFLREQIGDERYAKFLKSRDRAAL